MTYEIKVEFKTSEVIILDWIKLDEFLEEVYPSESFHSYNGMLVSTLEAAQRGFVRVHTGDISATIHRKDNNFSFGLAKEKKNYTNIGSVCMGVWAVTMIETKNFIDILANQVGQEEAKEMVSDYLQKKEHMKVNIEPGVYTLKFDPEAHHAKEMFSLKKDKVVRV